MVMTLISAVEMMFTVFRILLFVRVILSWFPMARGNPLMDLLQMLTEPVIAPIRSLVHRSPLGGPGMIIDFSVLIVFLLIHPVQMFVVSILRMFL